SFARRYAPAVRVNVIAPGTMDAGSYVPHTAGPPSPLGRFCTPEDIAQAALYLASAEAAYITGQTFVVNGGSIMF
ncbi:MAG TPA: SDR family oxidoreductase, partial [Ktedonobacteraceae bacterium]|nr:SDR family oxidoreductase [Ktedonobacteraceae bacterium]